MKKHTLSFFLLLPTLIFAQGEIASKMYSWQNPVTPTKQNIYSTTLFEGVAFDFEFLQVSANVMLSSGMKTSFVIPSNEEHLLLVKDGTLSLDLKDSAWSIGGGSVALFLPEEKYTLLNASKDTCSFYLMKYRSKLPVDMARGIASGGSFVKDWNKIPDKPIDVRNVRHYFDRPTAMGKRFEMHVTTLKPGIQSHEPHTHRAEEIVLVIENKTEMQIGDGFYKGGPGDIYFLGSNVSHAIRNDGKEPCVYFAFQFE